MTTIYLIRHAEAEGNIFRRIHAARMAGTTAPSPTAATIRSPRSQSALLIQNSTPFIQATVSAR